MCVSNSQPPVTLNTNKAKRSPSYFSLIAAHGSFVEKMYLPFNSVTNAAPAVSSSSCSPMKAFIFLRLCRRTLHALRKTSVQTGAGP